MGSNIKKAFHPPPPAPPVPKRIVNTCIVKHVRAWHNNLPLVNPETLSKQQTRQRVVFYFFEQL